MSLPLRAAHLSVGPQGTPGSLELLSHCDNMRPLCQVVMKWNVGNRESTRAKLSVLTQAGSPFNKKARYSHAPSSLLKMTSFGLTSPSCSSFLWLFSSGEHFNFHNQSWWLLNRTGAPLTQPMFRFSDKDLFVYCANNEGSYSEAKVEVPWCCCCCKTFPHKTFVKLIFEIYVLHCHLDYG